MYNYFIQTKKKIHKHDEAMQWMDSDTFVEFLKSVKETDKSMYVKSWRSRAKRAKKNG